MTDLSSSASTTGATFRFLDALAATRADTRRTDGQLGITEFWAAQGHGSPMVVHADEDEGYFVIEGEIEWRSGDDSPVRYGPGGLGWAPRGVAHAYTVSSPTARFLCLTTPAGLEGFFRQAGEPTGVDDLPVGGSVSDSEAGRAMAAVAEYGVTVVGPPRASERTIDTDGTRDMSEGTRTETEKNNAELVRRHFDVLWNHGELSAVEDFFGDEFANFGRRGPAAHALIRTIVAAWRAGFPDLHYEIDDEIVDADAVVHRVTLTGTHTGTFEHPAIGTLEATGRSFAVDQMHITRVRDGRIVEHWGTRNDLAMLQQLGALSSPQQTRSITDSAGWQRPEK